MLIRAMFFEQTEYPEEQTDEQFLTGLSKTKDFKARSALDVVEFLTFLFNWRILLVVSA